MAMERLAVFAKKYSSWAINTEVKGSPGGGHFHNLIVY